MQRFLIPLRCIRNDTGDGKGVMRGGSAAPHHPNPSNKSVIPTRSEESLEKWF